MPEPSAKSSRPAQPASNAPLTNPPTTDTTTISPVVQDTPSALPDMNVRRDETRRERNRQHARASRERKQLELQTLHLENSRLRNTVAALEREAADGANEINDLREWNAVKFRNRRGSDVAGAMYERSMVQNLNLRRQLQSCNPADTPHYGFTRPGHDR